jgi:polar amino acid transport system permease protein
MFWQNELDILPPIVDGIRTTIALLVLAWISGNALAILTALARVSRSLPLRALSWVYIQVIRGTPLLVQIYLLYYGIGSLLTRDPAIRHSIFWPILRDGFWYAVLALGVSTGAYSGEIIRGAISAVPRGEVEAARALGLGPFHRTRLIVLPRAIQSCLPALAGETILLLKSTALASTVTVLDVMGQAEYQRAQKALTYAPLLTAALVYIVLTLIITRLFILVERRMNRSAIGVIQTQPGH